MNYEFIHKSQLLNKNGDKDDKTVNHKSKNLNQKNNNNYLSVLCINEIDNTKKYISKFEFTISSMKLPSISDQEITQATTITTQYVGGVCPSHRVEGQSLLGG